MGKWKITIYSLSLKVTLSNEGEESCYMISSRGVVGNTLHRVVIALFCVGHLINTYHSSSCPIGTEAIVLFPQRQ